MRTSPSIAGSCSTVLLFLLFLSTTAPLRAQDGANFRVTEMVTTLQNLDLRGVTMYDSAHGVAVGEMGAIAITYDAGRHWKYTRYPTDRSLNAIARTTAGILVAVGDHGMILRSTDSGATWEERSGNTERALRKAAFTSEGNGIAVGDGAIITSTDAGRTWRNADFPYPPPFMHARSHPAVFQLPLATRESSSRAAITA